MTKIIIGRQAYIVQSDADLNSVLDAAWHAGHGVSVEHDGVIVPVDTHISRVTVQWYVRRSWQHVSGYIMRRTQDQTHEAAKLAAWRIGADAVDVDGSVYRLCEGDYEAGPGKDEVHIVLPCGASDMCRVYDASEACSALQDLHMLEAPLRLNRVVIYAHDKLAILRGLLPNEDGRNDEIRFTVNAAYLHEAHTTMTRIVLSLGLILPEWSEDSAWYKMTLHKDLT